MFQFVRLEWLQNVMNDIKVEGNESLRATSQKLLQCEISV